jgi:hypothetical protein
MKSSRNRNTFIRYDRHANSFEIDTNIPEKEFYDYLFDVCRIVKNGGVSFSSASKKDDLGIAVFSVSVFCFAGRGFVEIITNGSESMARSVLSYLLSFCPGQKPDERIIFV